MTASTRTPTTLDTSAITGPAIRIHPDDLRELLDAYRFCWPENGRRDVWKGTRLLADVEAALLPRVGL